ncbi:MAG: hypothetical protein DRQ51_10490 [Gammaproteobacteria bacterium]|nr:MAG: hypothetical protein DRQ51_10490 [Gammaproteobacteria bacterium]
MSKKTILIRVAVDQTFGKWNSPCNSVNQDFVYVPIPESYEVNQNMRKSYKDYIKPALDVFSNSNNCDVKLPDNLQNDKMHLDPDFDYLTYGDSNVRGKKLLDFKEDDIVIFYAGLQPIDGSQLVYALIGMYVVDDIKQVKNIKKGGFDKNAHTRYKKADGTDVVVTGKKGKSGRFKKYIPVGEWRNNAYRVKKDILDEWGGLGIKDGFLQRSANPPLFLNPEKFLKWLDKQNPTTIDGNNLL